MGASEALGVRIGFAGGTTVSSIDQVGRDVQWATDAGFDSYWLSFVAGVDPLVALAVIADQTQHIELGTSVMPTVGRHPIALAQTARTTQQACRGRFTLGVGPSHQTVAEDIYGESWARPFERASEYLSALIPLCNGEPVAVSGNQVSAHFALEVPSEPVPVVLAALGPKMLDLAGRIAAGTHVGQCGPKTIREHTVPTIRAAAQAAGRSEPRIIALVNICVTDDPAGVRGAVSETAAWYGALPSYRAMLDREGVDDPTELVLAGSMSKIAEGLLSYAQAGVTDLRLGILAPDDDHHRATRDALAEWIT